MEQIKRFFYEESAIEVIEMLLLLIALIGLVVIFRTQLTTLLDGIFTRITNEIGTF